MATTYYVPSSSGWTSTDSNGQLRLKVVQSYNATTNVSTLTVSVQARLPNSSYPSGEYYLGYPSVSTLSNDNGTLYTFSTTRSDLVHKANLTQNGSWVDVKSSSYPNSWTMSVSHSANGSASCSFSFTGTLCYMGTTTGPYFNAVSYTLDISQTRTFTLSISAGTGSSIVVKKGSTTLSNGAAVTYGDTLTVTFSAATGYNLSTHKVNGSNFTSGNSHTVTGAVSVTSTATLKSFTLSISAGTNTTITVNRTSSPLGKGSTGNLSNGATVYYNDVLKVSYSVSTGCTIKTHTINGSQFTSGDNHTVTAAVSVITTATVNSYKLTLSVGANTTITVNRTSSPLGKAATGYIQNGATIYYNDVLNISWSADTGYRITTRTVNGNTETSGQSYTVTSAVSVVVAATVRSYSITATVDQYANVQITRTASPKAGAQTGLITDSTVYYGDVLSIQAIPNSGYGIDSFKVNSTESTNPKSITVSDNVTIVVIAKALGFMYIDSGSSIEKYMILIDSGSALEQYRAMIDTGSAIVPY